MTLPKQALPIIRLDSDRTVAASIKKEGITPSNNDLRCQLCCEMSKDIQIDCSRIFPGCACSIR